jgi:alginate O-acetyltransferase complex protein AlgI
MRRAALYNGGAVGSPKPFWTFRHKLCAVLAALFALLVVWTTLIDETPIVDDQGLPVPTLAVNKDVSGAMIARLPPNGLTRHLVLDVTISEAAARLEVTSGDNPKPQSLDADNRFCSALSTSQLSCHIPIAQKADADIVVRLAPSGSDELHVSALDFRVMRSIRTAPFSADILRWVAICAVLALPVVWLLHHHLAASQWVLVSLSVACLFALQPTFTTLLLGFLLAMYGAGRGMQLKRTRQRAMLAYVVAAAVAFLFIFKYGPDLVYGIFSVPLGLFVFPIGLSYFVIRLIDVQLRWYRQELPDLGVREYLCYQLFLPTVPAGPIETIDQFRARRLLRIRTDDIAYGFGRIVIGLLKELIVADWLLAGLLYDPEQGYYLRAVLDPLATAPSVALIFGLLVFLYAYIDFSSYSDIAIGAGRLFGYQIRENFDWPILARNLSEFWRRWHMSLSGWCMRNLYFQMLLITRSTYLPLFATMIVIGLWHNFTLGWFLWGLHHASALALLDWWANKRRRAPNRRVLARATRPLSTIATMYYISVGYSFVGAHDFATALSLYTKAWAAPVHWLIAGSP